MSNLPSHDPFKKKEAEAVNIITTLGDARANTIDALGEMKIVQSDIHNITSGN